jgi:hypothetical protein
MYIEDELIPDEHDLVLYKESNDPMEVAYSEYMSSQRRGVSAKVLAEKNGISVNALKHKIHKWHIGFDGTRWPPWVKLRDEMHLRLAKQLIKPALPEISACFAKNTTTMTALSDLISIKVHKMLTEQSEGKDIDLKEAVQTYKDLVACNDKLLKAKRLEVGEAVQHVEVHSKTISKELSDEDTYEILQTKGIPDSE